MHKYLAYFCVVLLNVFSWFIILMIPTLEISTCTMGSEDAWLVTGLFYMPLILIISALLPTTKTIKWAKWLSLPHVILIPWAAIVILKYLKGVTIQGHHFCTILNGTSFDGYNSSWWAVYWAPAMLLSISFLCVGHWLVWRGSRS